MTDKKKQKLLERLNDNNNVKLQNKAMSIKANVIWINGKPVYTFNNEKERIMFRWGCTQWIHWFFS